MSSYLDPKLDALLLALGLINAISFIGYGITCVFTLHMKNEFIRYKLPELRVMTGVLQTLAGFIMLYGLVDRRFLFIGSLSIVPMMLTGVIVRVRIKDPYFLIVPAFSYLLISLYLVFAIPNL